MLVPFVMRSEFLLPIAEALKTQHAKLKRTIPMHVKLKSGGYNAAVYVQIDLSNRSAFRAEWEGELTRFPVRVRAAATALRDAGVAGRFQVIHEDGALVISPA